MLRRAFSVLVLIVSSLFFAVSASAEAPASAQQADRQLVQAITNKDKPSLDSLLDEKLTWTDPSGKTYSKSNLPVDLSAASEVKVHEYGSVAYLTGIAGQDPRIRFVRVWVKNEQSKWQLLLVEETKQMGKVATPQATVPVGTACDNPCKTVPYDAPSADAKAVVDSWQALEAAVNHRNADGWAAHVADEFVFNVKEDGNPLTKADRVAIIRKQAEGKTVTDIGTVIPGTMKVWVYGTTAVMSDEQQPTTGGHPYSAMRIWLKRDGRWQLVYSQQTVIEAS